MINFPLKFPQSVLGEISLKTVIRMMVATAKRGAWKPIGNRTSSMDCFFWGVDFQYMARNSLKH